MWNHAAYINGKRTEKRLNSKKEEESTELNLSLEEQMNSISDFTGYRKIT